jgi:hypothetical protein
VPAQQLPLLFLGGGSNLLLTRTDVDALVLRMASRIRVLSDDGDAWLWGRSGRTLSIRLCSGRCGAVGLGDLNDSGYRWRCASAGTSALTGLN